MAPAHEGRRRPPRRGNFFYLFLGLLVLALASPMVSGLGARGGFVLMQLATAFTLVIGVWSLAATRHWFYLGLVMAVGDAIATLMAIALGSYALAYAILIDEFLFFLLTAILLARSVFATGPVDLNRIVGSICIYLLLGNLWGILYLGLDFMDPGSFSGLAAGAPLAAHLSTLNYFSFITLTTLGYGDIQPLTPFARSLAYVEAIVGQFYMAVVVASLVGMHIAARTSTR